MNLSERLAALNHLQRTRRFKIVASAALIVVSIIAFAIWWTALNAPSADAAAQAPTTESVQQDTPSPANDDPEPAADGRATGSEAIAQRESQQDFQPRLDASAVMNAIGSRDATLGVATGLAAALAIALLVIWLGAGLTYLALAILTAIIVVPLKLIPGTSELATALTGVAILAACFTIFIETARVALTASHPVFAIARTVVAEAVRMKISIVFMILLIGWLAALPWLLDDAQPLRFRVQTFLRNGSAGAFWALALLTMFFSVATVSFEQRDKTVWSTVVKPVKPWHYILGKWVGLMSLNAALLAVSASGVFLFTEYLRAQPAVGEIAPYVNASGGTDPTADRLILEARILTARDSREPSLPEIPIEVISQVLKERVDEAMAAETVDNPQKRQAMEAAILPNTIKRLEASRTAIAPLAYKDYVFENLSAAKALGRPVTLRFKVEAGANDPTSLYALLFEFIDDETRQTIPLSIDTPLNIAQSIDLRPNVIDSDGNLFIRVYNFDPLRQRSNPLTIRFPPEGLEVFYVRGGYEMNFLRITAALWVKLGFIAAAGIFAATFLSFPVAALFSFLVLFAAETSGFLDGSLGIYTAYGHEGEIVPHRIAIRAIAIPIAKVFVGYRELDSTHRLVDGKLLSWSEFTTAASIILALTGAFLVSAAAIFKKRELATYSGH